MSSENPLAVFLNHGAKDKAVVRPLAGQLRKDGMKVWFDEWVFKLRDRISAKIEDGLERTRVMLLYVSANTFGSEWAKLEAGTCGRGQLPFLAPLTRNTASFPCGSTTPPS